MTNHPITPPPELVQQWASESLATQHLCTQAAQWGADQRGTANEAELQEARDEEREACIEWVSIQLNCTDQEHLVPHLRAARRPKPPTLKEQALTALQAVVRGAMDIREQHQNLDTIRRALETLDD
jgi:hypothetical protein